MSIAPNLPIQQLYAPSRTGDSWQVEFPECWHQGRGVFGGLIVGAMVKALEESNPDRPLRSFNAEMCGPVLPGKATLTLEVFREGSAVTTIEVRIVQNGTVQACGIGVLGKERPVNHHVGLLQKPDMPSWKDVLVLDLQNGPSYFSQWFEYRPAYGTIFSKQAAELGLWIRPRNTAQKCDSALLAACTDASYPAFWVSEDSLRPSATVAYTLQTFGPFEDVDGAAPIFIHAQLIAFSKGYAIEYRDVWSESGRLLALNQQTLVLIK